MTSHTDTHAGDDQGSGALTMETARLAKAVLGIICAIVDVLPEGVLARRPAARAAVVRRLYFYTLSSWMGSPVIGRITGFNSAHINREINAIWAWAENNAMIETLVERLDAWFGNVPEVLREAEELTAEMMLERAEERVRAAADRVSQKAAPPPPAALRAALKSTPAPKKKPSPQRAAARTLRLAALDGARV